MSKRWCQGWNKTKRNFCYNEATAYIRFAEPEALTILDNEASIDWFLCHGHLMEVFRNRANRSRITYVKRFSNSAN